MEAALTMLVPWRTLDRRLPIGLCYNRVKIKVIWEMTLPLSYEAHSDVYHATLSCIIHGDRHVLGL